MPDGAKNRGPATFAGLVAAAVFVVENSRPPHDAAGSPDPAVLARLRRSQGSVDDLDAWREAYGWEVPVLLDVLGRVLGILDMMAPGGEQGELASPLADSTPGAGADAAFPRVLRRSAYLPLVDTPEAERVLAWARVVGRALTLMEPPPLSLRVTGFASDLSMVAKDLEAVAKELRESDAVVLGGQVVRQRRLLTRVVDALDGVATELKDGRLR